MKNKLILSVSCLVILTLCMIGFISCDEQGNVETNDTVPQSSDETGNVHTSDSSSENSEAHSPVFSCYLDSDERTANVDNVNVSILSYYEYARLNNDLHITILLHNSLNEINRMEFTDIYVVRESNGSSYKYEAPVSIEINADLNETASLTFEIPTSIQEDRYYLEFMINQSRVRFFLYSTPDELLESHTVTYMMNGAVVHEEQVLHGKALPQFEWFSKNGLYYCVKWSNEDLDAFYEDYANRNTPYKVKNDMTLEGEEKDMLEYMSFSSDTYAFVEQLNQDGVVPPNKTLVIPEKYQGKPIRISNFFFDAKLKDIEIVYIPHTDRIYYQTLSKTQIKEIHFAGTEEEWNALDVDVPSRIKVYFNSEFKEP